MRRIVSSIAVAAALAVAMPATATVLYSTGFEAPTFTTGPLNGQGGWVVSGSGTPGDVTVENVVAHGGEQAVEFPSGAGGVLADFALGPITPTDPIVVSMAIKAEDTGATPAAFAVATNPGFDDITAGVRVAGGDLHALSPGVPAIGTYTPGTWIDVSMTLDYATQTYSVSVDGAPLASDLRFCGGMSDSQTCHGNHVSQFVDVEFIPDSPKFGEFDIDDVSISEVPEPGAWALMLVGFAGLGGVMRSRRGRQASLAG